MKHLEWTAWSTDAPISVCVSFPRLTPLPQCVNYVISIIHNKHTQWITQRFPSTLTLSSSAVWEKSLWDSHAPPFPVILLHHGRPVSFCQLYQFPVLPFFSLANTGKLCLLNTKSSAWERHTEKTIEVSRHAILSSDHISLDRCIQSTNISFIYRLSFCTFCTCK